METIKKIVFAALVLFIGEFHAQNLVQNGSFDAPLTKETRLIKNAGWANLKIFTEDTTWNKAARMTVTEIYTMAKNGHKHFLAWIYVGGDGSKNTSAYKIEPETSYRFSLRLKTNIKPEQANILCRVGNFGADGKQEKRLAQTPVLKNLNEKDWTNISGTFHSGKETEVLLWIPIYSNTEHNEKMLMSVGQWLMVDDVVIEKIQTLPEVSKSEKKN